MPQIKDLEKLTARDLANDDAAVRWLVNFSELSDDVGAWFARRDVNVFIPYVFNHEQEDFHIVLQQLVDDNREVSLDCAIEHGKSTQMSVMRAIFELGHNINHTIAIVGCSKTMPTRSLRTIKNYIEHSKELSRVFPDLRVDKYSETEGLYVERPVTMDKEPSVSASGILGSIIGSRYSLLITDDILDYKNTYTEGLRTKVWEVLTSTLLGRLTANGRHIDIGTPWNVDDARHQLRKMYGYKYFRFDADTGNMYEGKKLVRTFEGGLWPRIVYDKQRRKEFGYPRERLDKKKKQLPALEYDRQFRCIALSGSLRIFNPESLARAAYMGRGQADEFREEIQHDGRVRRLWRLPMDATDMVVTGVDLAIQRTQTAHNTAMFTGCIRSGMRHILEIRVGKMEITEIVRAMIEIVRTYPSHKGLRVENNSAQDYVLQFLRQPDLVRAVGATNVDIARITPVPHTTTAVLKHDPEIGVRAMAQYFDHDKWPIPSDEFGNLPSLLQDWFDGMVNFDPTGHTSDILMASWLFDAQLSLIGHGNDRWQRLGIAV